MPGHALCFPKIQFRHPCHQQNGSGGISPSVGHLFLLYLIRFFLKKVFLLKDFEKVFISLLPPSSKLAWLYACWHPKAEMSADIEGNRKGMLTPSRD